MKDRKKKNGTPAPVKGTTGKRIHGAALAELRNLGIASQKAFNRARLAKLEFDVAQAKFEQRMNQAMIDAGVAQPGAYTIDVDSGEIVKAPPPAGLPITPAPTG